MDNTVNAATAAIEEFLRRVNAFDDEIIDQCDSLLISVWHVGNAVVRMQIIQMAAFNAGFLTEDAL